MTEKEELERMGTHTLSQKKGVQQWMKCRLIFS